MARLTCPARRISGPASPSLPRGAMALPRSKDPTPWPSNEQDLNLNPRIHKTHTPTPQNPQLRAFSPIRYPHPPLPGQNRPQTLLDAFSRTPSDEREEREGEKKNRNLFSILSPSPPPLPRGFPEGIPDRPLPHDVARPGTWGPRPPCLPGIENHHRYRFRGA